MNAHLCSKHILADSTWFCGHGWEDKNQFLAKCPIVAAQRVLMIDQLDQFNINSYLIFLDGYHFLPYDNF